LRARPWRRPLLHAFFSKLSPARRVGLLLAVVSLFATPALGQGTAFTYQGMLQSGDSPANGVYDVRFTACDAVTNGDLLGGPVTYSAVNVTNGQFTTPVDFGPGVFTGSAVWLQVDVRTNGATDFTPLSPREPVTATPYAVLAGTATSLVGPLSAGQLSGIVPATNLPPVLVTNHQPGVLLAGSFSGDGTGLANVTATPLFQGGQNHFQKSPPRGVGAIAGNGWTNCLTTMAAIKSSGLYALGYNWLFSDQGWCLQTNGVIPVLDARGFVQWNTNLWPLGNLTGYALHTNGFSFEVWEDSQEQQLAPATAVANFNNLATVIGANQIWLDDGSNYQFIAAAATALATNGANCVLSGGVAAELWVPSQVSAVCQNLVVHDAQGDAVNWLNGLAWLDNIATNNLSRLVGPGQWISMNGEGGDPDGGYTVNSLLFFHSLKCMYDMPIWLTSDWQYHDEYLWVYTNADLLNIQQDVSPCQRVACTNGCWWYLKQSVADPARYYLCIANTNTTTPTNAVISPAALGLPNGPYSLYDDTFAHTNLNGGAPILGSLTVTVTNRTANVYTLLPSAEIRTFTLFPSTNLFTTNRTWFTDTAAYLPPGNYTFTGVFKVRTASSQGINYHLLINTNIGAKHEVITFYEATDDPGTNYLGSFPCDNSYHTFWSDAPPAIQNFQYLGNSYVDGGSRIGTCVCWGSLSMPTAFPCAFQVSLRNGADPANPAELLQYSYVTFTRQ